MMSALDMLEKQEKADLTKRGEDAELSGIIYDEETP